MSRRCVFLDRDGVINENAAPGEYIRHWGEFRLLPNVAEWIRIFNVLGYLVIVVTNQRGVAKGVMRIEDVEDIHTRMIAELARRGARIDDVFYCPHEEDTCECRKPRPGMILQAQRKWDIDLGESLMIGDSERDSALAATCGMRFLRAQNGHLA